MHPWKIYNILLLSLSLTLTGCGSDSDEKDTTKPEAKTPDTTTPEVAALSVANPIADMTIVANTALDFSIPTDLCTAADGVSIKQAITEVNNNVGYGITNFTAMSGLATRIGVVTVTVTCSTETDSVTDEFTINVVDFEAAPTVTATAPSSANAKKVVTLTATASDQNLSGEIVSYAWVETSDLGITLTNSDTATATFSVPDTTAQSSAIFEVTVTDNDGTTATDSVEIILISTLAPQVSLSFPLAFGQYSAEAVDMFGNIEAATGHDLDTVIVTVDDVEHMATITGNTWRVEDVTLTETTDIKILATSKDDLISPKEITLAKNTLFVTNVDYNISDIAVNEKTDDVYINADGDTTSENVFTHFNLASGENSVLTVTQPTDFAFSRYRPTSLALDTTSDILFVSYEIGVSKIDLTTGNENVLSETPNTASGNVGFTMDLSYNSTTDTLYAVELNNKAISNINIDTGDRTEIEADLPVLLSVTSNLTTGDYYFSQGINTIGQAAIRKKSGTTTTDLYLTDEGEEGGPISDIAIDEANNLLFFVNGKGTLLKLDLANNNTTTEVITNLFSVETVLNAGTSLIGLHYHNERHVLIAVGKNTDGTNKLLVIDPVSGDYAKIATGE